MSETVNQFLLYCQYIIRVFTAGVLWIQFFQVLGVPFFPHEKKMINLKTNICCYHFLSDLGWGEDFTFYNSILFMLNYK